MWYGWEKKGSQGKRWKKGQREEDKLRSRKTYGWYNGDCKENEMRLSQLRKTTGIRMTRGDGSRQSPRNKA
jgi:hypothetical protein